MNTQALDINSSMAITYQIENLCKTRQAGLQNQSSHQNLYTNSMPNQSQSSHQNPYTNLIQNESLIYYGNALLPTYTQSNQYTENSHISKKLKCPRERSVPQFSIQPSKPKHPLLDQVSINHA